MSEVKQAGLNDVLMAGEHSPYSKVAETEGVVIAVRYIDDPKNLSKAYVEYDVRDLRTSYIYKNCRRGDQAAGMEDGDDNVLREARQQFGATTPVFDPKRAQLSQSDGDRVLITCSYGAQHNAVITAVLPHSRVTYGATRADGPRRLQVHKGTSVETKQDGTYQIKRGDTSITLNADETIEIVHKSGSVLRFLDNGDVEVVPNGNLLHGGVSGNNPTEGTLNGLAIDPFTGQTHFALGNASKKVFSKK